MHLRKRERREFSPSLLFFFLSLICMSRYRCKFKCGTSSTPFFLLCFFRECLSSSRNNSAFLSSGDCPWPPILYTSCPSAAVGAVDVSDGNSGNFHDVWHHNVFFYVSPMSRDSTMVHNFFCTFQTASQMRFRPLLLLLPLLLSGVVANSDGNLQNCNIDQKLDGVMPWVQAPVTSAQYSITSPSTNYTPGALTPISIVVNDLDFVYIGLMLVAQNSSGEYIGRWTVMDGDPFFLPSSCAGKAVVHTNADLKSTKHTFYWRGYKGAGTVTFRALIKWGEQATGKFYRPANLQLGEGPTAIPAAALQLGNPGDSCDETCGKKNKACDDVATLGLNSAALLQAQTDQYYVCRRPFLRFCGP